jgi:hypothetical protein
MAKKSARKRAVGKPAEKSRKAKAARKSTKDRDAFVASLIAHGQAAKPRADGTLPPGATHEITEGKDGEVKVVRRRFSLL